MKLSKESTREILNLQKSTVPLIHCISGLVTLNDLEQAILCYNGRAIMAHGIEEVYEISMASDGLLLSLATLDNNKILAMEKSLRAARKKNISVLLDISGVNLSVYRRDTALSFLNRYNIDVIKGTPEEIASLVKFQKRNRSSDEENFRNDLRGFARKNKTVIVMYDEKYYITDGFSEFYVNNGNKEFSKLTSIQCILSGMIAVAMAVFKKREERIQGILIATLVLGVAEELAFNKIIEQGTNVFIKSYLLDEIANIDEDKLLDNGKIIYEFKR